MNCKTSHAQCAEHEVRPLTFPDVTLILVVIVVAIALSLSGMPALAALVLLGEACAFGIRFVRRLRRSLLSLLAPACS